MIQVVSRTGIVFVLVIIMMMEVGRCMILNDNSVEEIPNQMLQHMKEKYGIEFVAYDLEQCSYNQSYDRFRCYPKDGDPKTDLVEVYRNGKGNDITYKDTYFGIIIREDIEAEIMNNCQQLSLEAKVFCPHGSVYDNMYDSTKGYADFKNDKNAPSLVVRIGVVFEPHFDTENICNELFQTMEAKGLRGTFNVYFITKEAFNKLNRENNRDILAPSADQILERYSRLMPRV